MIEESLKAKTIKGTFWSGADAFLGQGMTFVVGIVLARLLSPEEYGLIGICIIFTTVLCGVVDSGFSTALIRKNDVSDDDYNTMFITNLVMSLLMFMGLYVCALPIADFFERPELVDVIRAMGLILIFQALSITQVTILTKRIDFKTKTKASLSSAVCSGIIGVIMAYVGFGVWALVGQLLSRQIIYTICLWVLNRWWPSLRFNMRSFHYMWGFGWKMMLSGVLNNVWNQLYQVVAGKCYSPATLGQFSRANDYANLFSLNFTSIIQRVAFPALAEAQNDKERMLAAFRKIIKMTMFLVSIVMFLLAAISTPLIYCLIGPKWHEAATYLPVLCISMSMYPLHAINLTIIQVQGRSDIFLYLEILKKIIGVFPIVLGILVNIYWMLYGSLFVGFVNYYLNSYYVGKYLHYSPWMQLKDVAPSYILSLIIAVPVYFLKYLPINCWVVLSFQFLLAAIIFFVACYYCKFEEFRELKQVCCSAISKLKNI